MKKALFLAFALFTFFFTTSLLAVTTPIYWQSDASGTTCSASAAAVCYAPMNRSMPGGQMQEQSVVDANAWHMNVTTNSSIFLYDTNISGSAELTFFCNSTNRGGLLADIYTVTLYNMSGSPIGPSGAYTQLLSYAPAVGAASSTTSKNCTYDGAGVASQKNYPLGTVASTTILKPGDSLRLWINGTVLTAAASNYLYMIWGGNTQANLTIQESIRNGTLAANVSGPVSDQTIPSTGTASFNATVWCQNGGSCVNISTTVYMCSDAGAGCNPSAIVPLAGTVYADSSNKGVGYLTSANTSANISYTITSSGATVGTVYRFKFGANSTENEISQFKNSSIIRNFTIANIPPGYSSNSTNSTLAGAAISHSLYWTDNSGLSGYIFSFDNGTGTFVNDSFVQMLGNGNWSSVTKTANSTANATIRWIVYANNTNNFWNASLAYSYVTSAPPAPYTGWWNSSWQYRKPITINGSTSALTDYQVGYNITYATGINANFSDLRFTYYNATTATEAEIPYWIESNATASWAYVWFKTNLTTGNNKVYMYYGNSGASIASNGTNAFILFDHFNERRLYG
jgi:hypothetical protein